MADLTSIARFLARWLMLTIIVLLSLLPGNKLVIAEEKLSQGHFKLLPEESVAWRGYRGTQRHAQTPWLPDDFKKLELVWSFPLSSPGLAGLVADEKNVIVSTRDAADSMDIFYCINAESGEKKWEYQIPANGDLDYGNSPRATPWLAEDEVYVLNAFGQLVALELTTGKVLWQKKLIEEFDVEKPPKWGYAASPMIVDKKLIVQPGAESASIVALNPKDGSGIWSAPGKSVPYASLIAADYQEQSMLIGYDEDSLGGWELKSGKRLWRFESKWGAGLSVSTPNVYKNKLLLTDEVQGVELFKVQSEGKPLKEPEGILEGFFTQTHTPTVWKNRFLGIHGMLYLADLDRGLKESAPVNDGSFDQHCSIIASPQRVLILTANGRLMLLDPNFERPQLLGRTTISEDEKILYSFPAIVGSRLYVRTTVRLLCISLGKKQNP